MTIQTLPRILTALRNAGQLTPSVERVLIDTATSTKGDSK
jgi:hypothetical protein